MLLKVQLQRDTMEGIKKQLHHVVNILSRPGKLLPITQQWSRAMKQSIATEMGAKLSESSTALSASIDIAMESTQRYVKDALDGFRHELQSLKSRDQSTAESMQLLSEEVQRLKDHPPTSSI